MLCGLSAPRLPRSLQNLLNEIAGTLFGLLLDIADIQSHYADSEYLYSAQQPYGSQRDGANPARTDCQSDQCSQQSRQSQDGNHAAQTENSPKRPRSHGKNPFQRPTAHQAEIRVFLLCYYISPRRTCTERYEKNLFL